MNLQWPHDSSPSVSSKLQIVFTKNMKDSVHKLNKYKFNKSYKMPCHQILETQDCVPHTCNHGQFLPMKPFIAAGQFLLHPHHLQWDLNN